MSAIPTIEPPAQGLIELKTTFGNLDVELFTQQCPRITRNFVQLCLDGYYNETIFNRVEKDFIAIGGVLEEEEEDNDVAKPTETFPDEFHSRLRFTRRGLLATANTEKDANGTEFFFTLGPTPELQNKHTIFGRLKGNSVYQLVDLNDCEVDEDQKPLGEKRILEVVVVENPYPELTPREEYSHTRRRKQDSGKNNEVYDPINKPKASSFNSKKLSFFQESDDEEEEEEDQPESKQDTRASKQQTPQTTIATNDLKPKLEPKTESSIDKDSSDKEQCEITGDDKATSNAREQRLQEIRQQIQELKKQFDSESKDEPRKLSDRRMQKESDSQTSKETDQSNLSRGSSVQTEMDSSRDSRGGVKRGRHRERETMEAIQSFKKKLKESSDSRTETKEQPKVRLESFDDSDDELANLDIVDGDAWLHHKFEAPVTESPMAKDANTKDDNWYSIEDPRNPMIKRIESDRSREYSKSSHRGDKRREDKNSEHKSRRHR